MGASSSKGQSKERSRSGSTSTSSSASNSFIDPTQAGYLNDLWNSAGNFMAGGGGAVNPNQQATALDMTVNNPYMASVNNFATPNNDLLNQQIDSLSSNLSDQFNNVIMPGITSEAQIAGQYGGGRQGVAEANAAGKFADAFTNGATALYSNAYNTANQAAQFGATQFSNMANQYNNVLSSQQMQNMLPFITLSQILGNPTVLNQSTSQSDASSWSTGKSDSWNLGATIGAS